MKSHVLSARHVSGRLRLKQIAEGLAEPTHNESSIELIYKYGENSYVFVFHFGSVVFVDVSDEDEEKFMARIQKVADMPTSTVTEDFVVEEDRSLPGETFHDTGFNKVKIKNLTFPVLRLVALVIAESAAIDTYEATAEDLLNKSRRISRNLKTTGKPRLRMKEMVQFVGDCLNTKQEIIADLYVVDAPDETWDNQDLDRLYADMKRLFEVETRYKVLEFKLQLVHETVDVVVDMLRFRQQTFMELVIIFLIATEIIWLAAIQFH
ncbi:MAG: RMD1 family protein [Bdellovibrionia bacterium]